MKLLRYAGPVALILGTLLVTAAEPVQAQERGNWNQDYDPHVAAIGLGLGFTSGTGLAVRWPALPQTMVSATGGAWGSSDDLRWNVGFELHTVLRQAGRTRFFVGPAIAFYSDDEDEETNTNISAGVGLEILIRPRVSAKVDLGFTWFSDTEDIFPMPQASIFYYF